MFFIGMSAKTVRIKQTANCVLSCQEDINLNFKHFTFLQGADILTTFIGITYLNLTELNSFANGLFNEYGLEVSLVLGKIILLIVLWYGLKLLPLNIKKIYLNIICTMFILVIANNGYQIISYFH